ncbi:MAG: response regulator [Polyangiaceae bacterium]
MNESMADAPKVLLVDDNAESLHATAMHLIAQGFRVTCHDSPFGVTNIIARERPDVVVLDVMMPALSGAALGAIIREKQGVHIIYFSAMPEEELHELVSSTRNSSYVLRSEGPAYLAEQIVQSLGARGLDSAEA